MEITKNIKVRLQVIAVNILTPTPKANVRAKPFTNPEPNLKKYSNLTMDQQLEHKRLGILSCLVLSYLVFVVVLCCVA